jgi:hypothetical protein
MSDIVFHLRRRAAIWDNHPGRRDGRHSTLDTQAADEIERLLAEIKQLRAERALLCPHGVDISRFDCPSCASRALDHRHRTHD